MSFFKGLVYYITNLPNWSFTETSGNPSFDKTNYKCLLNASITAKHNQANTKNCIPWGSNIVFYLPVNYSISNNLLYSLKFTST